MAPGRRSDSLQPIVVSFGSGVGASHRHPGLSRNENPLTGLARRAKRAAVKLLYEALEKVLRIFRSAIPQDSPVPIASALAELVDWLAAFALKTKIRNALEHALQVDALQSHATATLGALPATEAAVEPRVCGQSGTRMQTRRFNYRSTAAAYPSGPAACSSCSTCAPPVSQIVVGCVTIGLCGLSGWLAQDFLDHPVVPIRPAEVPRRPLRGRRAWTLKEAPSQGLRCLGAGDNLRLRPR